MLWSETSWIFSLELVLNGHKAFLEQFLGMRCETFLSDAFRHIPVRYPLTIPSTHPKQIKLCSSEVFLVNTTFSIVWLCFETTVLQGSGTSIIVLRCPARSLHFKYYNFIIERHQQQNTASQTVSLSLFANQQGRAYKYYKHGELQNCLFSLSFVFSGPWPDLESSLKSLFQVPQLQLYCIECSQTGASL